MKEFLVLSLFLVSHLFIVVNCNGIPQPSEVKRTPIPIGMAMKKSSFWREDAQNTLQEKLRQTLNEKKAKNVIMFLGDGMSIDTVTAARILKGQLENKLGERSSLSFERFPAVGLTKTYCVDRQVADSACTATAYLGGVKANLETIGVNANVTLNDCERANDPNNRVVSIAGWAQKANKSTGLVTVTTVTHASPAGLYSHVANREFESDNMVKLLGHNPDHCVDSAQQLVYNDIGKKLNVVMGGGTKRFLPNGTVDFYGNSGERLDGKNLIREWRNSKPGLATTVFNRKQLLGVDFNETDYLMGLFGYENMNFKLDADIEKEPTLAEMTEAAIKVLQKNKNGFFLFVEGGNIDLAHHLNQAQKALVETLEFSKAIEKALNMTNSDETLIVVTADHSHTMTFSGYSDIGNNILGLSSEKSDIDKLPYTTLSYANGPSYYKHFNWTGERLDLTHVNVLDKEFQYASTFPEEIETHGGSEVAVYAKGPWSHLFTGVFEQNLVPHMMAYAACIGEGATMCQPGKGKNSAAGLQISVFLVLLSLFVVLFKKQ